MPLNEKLQRFKNENPLLLNLLEKEYNYKKPLKIDTANLEERIIKLKQAKAPPDKLFDIDSDKYIDMLEKNHKAKGELWKLYEKRALINSRRRWIELVPSVKSAIALVNLKHPQNMESMIGLLRDMKTDWGSYHSLKDKTTADMILSHYNVKPGKAELSKNQKWDRFYKHHKGFFDTLARWDNKKTYSLDTRIQDYISNTPSMDRFLKSVKREKAKHGNHKVIRALGSKNIWTLSSAVNYIDSGNDNYHIDNNSNRYLEQLVDTQAQLIKMYQKSSPIMRYLEANERLLNELSKYRHIRKKRTIFGTIYHRVKKLFFN